MRFNVQHIVKRVVIVMASVSTAAVCFGQGQINFFTYNAANANLGTVFVDAAKTIKADNGYYGQLLGGTTAGSLSAIGSPALFGAGPAAGIINSGSFGITGTNPGDTYYYALAAWSSSAGATYAAALAAGAVTDSRVVGTPVQVTLGGTGPGGVFPVPTANGFNNFSLVPEPSTIVLGLLGAGALLLRRRK